MAGVIHLGAQRVTRCNALLCVKCACNFSALPRRPPLSCPPILMDLLGWWLDGGGDEGLEGDMDCKGETLREMTSIPS